MKTLEILSRLREQIVDSYTPPYNVEISYTEDFESDIVQATAELEEAQETIKNLQHNYDVQVEYNNTAYKNYTNMVNLLAQQLKAKDDEIDKYQMAIDKQAKRIHVYKVACEERDEEIERLKAEKESLCKIIKDLQTANTLDNILQGYTMLTREEAKKHIETNLITL